MDRTDRDGSLDETLPSGDFGPSPETRPTGPTPAMSAPIERGTVIGRYTVIERVGSGTMGVVLAAFDPTLDRKVAIKLVQLDPTGSTSGRQRLVREAQAMAKLQHPNVVTVFEVGTFEDRVFLAMEYVAGSTLLEWLAQPERTRKEIVEAFVAAGHGLAAAHRTGIVHRDFKPTNVLVGKDGRVRVADFGLATAATDTPLPIEISRDSDPGPLGMTKTGAILGTPAYMSPEQHRGEVADARADQYAFCVALYEALYKQLPFEGDTFLVYHDNVLAGRIREPPRGNDVPASIQRVIRRGIALAPGDRYPSMDKLLGELAHDPAALRLRLALAGGGVVAVGAIAFALARTTSGGDDPCAAADQPLADVWTAPQRGALEDSFRASGSPAAAGAFARIARVLDDRAGALRGARREACTATAVRHEQSEALLDRRIACVDQRADATRALIGVLTEHHDADATMKGLDAAMSLPAVESCADRAELLAEATLPPIAIRPQVEALEHRLDRVEAMANAGMYPKALEELDQIAPAADKLAHAPLSARAHFLAGDAHIQLDHNQQGIAEFRRASELAAAAHDDKLFARSWIGMYAATGYRLGHVDEARGMEPAAAAAVVRANNDPSLLARLENARGLVDLGRDDYGPAAEHFRAAIREQEKAGHAEASNLAHTLTNLGTTMTWAKQFDEARAAHERALAIRIEMFGPEHPDVAFSYHGLGILFDELGKPEQALEQFQKSAQISEKVYPPDSSHIAKALVSLGLVYGELERPDDQLEYQKRALAIFEKHPEDNRHTMNTVLYDLGLAYLNAHHPKEAVETLLRALDVASAEHGADSLEVAEVLGGLLAAEDHAGDRQKGKDYGERSLAIRETKLGPDHEQIARLLGDLAANANERHAPKEAMPLIDRALAIIEKPGAPPLAVRFEMRAIRATAELALGRTDDALADAHTARDGFLAANQPMAAAEVRLVVADTLWKQAHRAEAIAEAKAALDTLQAEKKPDLEVLAKVRTWLATHAG